MNGFIVVDPTICSGKPVVRGTRIMVKNILGMVAGGYSMDRILDAYPELTREMVQAALEYAAAVAYAVLIFCISIPGSAGINSSIFRAHANHYGSKSSPSRPALDFISLTKGQIYA